MEKISAVKKFKLREKVRRTTGEKIIQYTLVVVFTVYSISLIFPLVWAFLTSLKTHSEYMLNSPFALPEQWLFSNYIEAFNSLEVDGTSFFGMLINSLWYAFGMCLGNVFVCSITAYVIARYPFKGSQIIYNAILIMMLMPIIGNGPTVYKMYSYLGIIDSPLFLISNAGGLGINFLFLEGFYRNVAGSYAEAASIDGANHYTTYFKIVFPQAMGLIATLVIIQFVGYWNDYAAPMLFLRSWPTLSVGVYKYESAMIKQADMPIYFAGIVITVIPVLTLFCLFQNSIMEKVSLGGIKG